jgi:hypothetical protein
MPGCAFPITRYGRIPPKSRGQRRGILRVDARTRERHVGINPTARSQSARLLTKPGHDLAVILKRFS